MALFEGKAQLAQVALLVLQLQAEPGAFVLHQLQTPIAVGLFPPALHQLAGEKIRHPALEERGRRIATQGGVALAGLQDRPPQQVEEEHHPHHQHHRPELAGEEQGLADQQGEHAADH